MAHRKKEGEDEKMKFEEYFREEVMGKKKKKRKGEEGAVDVEGAGLEVGGTKEPEEEDKNDSSFGKKFGRDSSEIKF